MPINGRPQHTHIFVVIFTTTKQQHTHAPYLISTSHHTPTHPHTHTLSLFFSYHNTPNTTLTHTGRHSWKFIIIKKNFIKKNFFFFFTSNFFFYIVCLVSLFYYFVWWISFSYYRRSTPPEKHQQKDLSMAHTQRHAYITTYIHACLWTLWLSAISRRSCITPVAHTPSAFVSCVRRRETRPAANPIIACVCRCERCVRVCVLCVWECVCVWMCVNVCECVNACVACVDMHVRDLFFYFHKKWVSEGVSDWLRLSLLCCVVLCVHMRCSYRPYRPISTTTTTTTRPPPFVVLCGCFHLF